MEKTNKPQMKVVNKEDNTTESKPQEQRKLSYEELVNVATQLSNENRILHQRFEQASYQLGYKRLDYLFKVLEFDANFEQSFVDKCAEEIQFAMAIPDEVASTEEDNNMSNVK